MFCIFEFVLIASRRVASRALVLSPHAEVSARLHQHQTPYHTPNLSQIAFASRVYALCPFGSAVASEVLNSCLYDLKE